MKFWALALLILACAPPAKAEDLNTLYQAYAPDTLEGLDQPNRSINELGGWISEAVANALNFKPGLGGKTLTEAKALFTDKGYETYVAFIAAQGFGAALQAQTLKAEAIVNAMPVLLGQGASAGRYAWAFEMPVVLSARTSPDAAPISRTVTLRIQIGRSAKADNPAGVLIENWMQYTPDGITGAPTQSTGTATAK